MTVETRWANTAARDLEAAFEHLSSVNRRAAVALVRRVLAAVESLSENPGLGREVMVNERAYLVLVVRALSIYYRLDDKGVIIVRLWDGRRDPSSFVIPE